MKYKIALLPVLLLLSLLSLAQTPVNLTLPAAVDLSIANSKYLHQNEVAIQKASAALTEARQNRLPNASVSGSYLQLSQADVNLKIKNNNPANPPNETPKVSNAMYGTLNLSLPIYTGGKLKFGIAAAELLEKATRLDLDNQKEEVINNAIEAYANLFKAFKAVDLVKENLAQAKQREKEFSDLEKNGLLARNDLLKTQLQTANTELALLDAENNLDLAKLNMNLLLGQPLETPLQINLPDLNYNSDSLTMMQYLQAAAANRPDVAANILRADAAEYAVKAIKAERMPNLALTGGYIAANIPKVLTISNAINIGVGVNYNIASLWKNKAKVEQAEANTKQLQLQNEIINDRITQQVSSQFLNLQHAQKKITVLQQATEQAKENYRIVNNKYNNSLSTLSDLLEADVARLQSDLNLLVAKVDGFVAYNHLLQSAGLLSKTFQK